MKIRVRRVLLGLALMSCGGEGSDAAVEVGDRAPGNLPEAPTADREPVEAAVTGAPIDPNGSGALRGRIEMTGTAEMPSVLLTDATGQGYPLAGELWEELSRLSGATVRVTGTKLEDETGGNFHVDDYIVLEIDGEEPLVGTILEHHGELQLRTADVTLAVQGAPDGLSSAVGAKVWILGSVVDKAVSVSSFGIISVPD